MSDRQVRGRAFVVPGTAGTSKFDSNNMSPNATAKTRMLLEITSVDDGQPGVAGAHPHIARIPLWVRGVLHSAGTNDPLAAHLPATLHLPVTVDAVSRQVTAVDWDLAITELQPYRDVAVRDWKESDSVLAPLRAARRLPGEAIRGGKGLLREWRDGIRDLKDDHAAYKEAAVTGKPPPLKGPAWTDEEAEQARRTAVTQRYYFEQRPKERARLRASTLEVAPSMVAQVLGGTRHPVDFEHWLVMQETSGILTPDEVSELRRQAAEPSD